MVALLLRVMERYGTDILWHHGEQEELIRGFLQSVTTRSWQKLKREPTPVGDARTGMYVFYCPADIGLSSGDRLTLGDRSNVIRRTEIIYGLSQPAYCWALCARRGGRQ